MSHKRWFILFAYLIAASILGMIILALAAFIFSRLFLLIFQGIPLTLPFSDLIRYLKAASLAGTVIGCGCWYIYYRHYRK
ncbi:hypothetical protein [Dryocola clanedunensis]|uniref:hypothetical protein n=1 Tax=Cedecea sulfonylureivorans TaxID=3051154 RepID=UPI0019265FA2|nr:hypothetical protein [Cedecea sulfonylureivorans]